ncbi:hypothetical protein ACUNWD_16900 [Sunxiuqinia sp. A32]|uniref:hypothetical protein n=1 Tax=Sunxiuqinia sp. A32 TaxID=3461496 RepID=UPI004045788B
MKKIISILCVLVIAVSCIEQPYYEIPTDENGNVLLTGVSSTETEGISTLDESFTVTAQFATAKSGDVMNVELLKLQTPPNGGATKQLLPLTGTQKTVTVGSDLKASVTYTRQEAQMTQEGDYATVIFAGESDYAKQRVTMEFATTATKPKVGEVTVDVARTPETAYFEISVDPKSAAYSGNLVAKRKNGSSAAWVEVAGSPFTGSMPFMVPISGDDFAADNDTMIYSFVSTVGSYSDEITTTIIVRDPYLYIKRSATLNMGGSSAGRNLLVNGAVAADDAMAMVAISGGSLLIQGGSEYLAGGNTIEFVPGTANLYDLNNATNIKATYDAGTPTASADPVSGDYFIFKAVTGPDAEDVFYGMMKLTNVTPGASVSFEYKIGDQYAHLAVIE